MFSEFDNGRIHFLSFLPTLPKYSVQINKLTIHTIISEDLGKIVFSKEVATKKQPCRRRSNSTNSAHQIFKKIRLPLLLYNLTNCFIK